MKHKLLVYFVALMFAMYQPFAFAAAAPKLDFVQIKNTSIDNVSKSVKADFIFKSAANDASYHAIKGKNVSYVTLSKVARKRLFCGSPIGLVGCSLAREVAYNYFSDELGLRDFNYNADTGTFKKAIPNRYRLVFSVAKPDFSGNRIEATTVQGVLNKHAAETGKETTIKPSALASIEEKVSNLNYPALNFSNGKYSQFGNYFNSGTSFTNMIDIVVYDAPVIGVEYMPNGEPTAESVSLTAPQLEAKVLKALESAPPQVVYDLIKSDDFVAEGHEAIIEASSQSMPYDVVTGEYLDPNPDPDPNPNPDPDPNPNPDPDPDPNPNPNPETGGFALPSFCSWAEPLCNLADFVTGEADPPPKDTNVDVSDAMPDKSAADFDKSYVDFGTTCPSFEPHTISVGAVSQSISIDLQPLCDLATLVRPAIVGMSYFTALGIVTAAIRET